MGCLLFQFPPSFKYDSGALELILKNLKPQFNNVVEFGNYGWWNKDVYDALEANNIIFCSVNHPQLPEDITITSSIVYVRLHLNPQVFYSPYSVEFLLSLHAMLINNTK